MLLFFVAILEYVAWGAVEHTANGVERGETHGLGFAGLENGKVGDGDAYLLAEFVERDFALGHHHIKIYDNHRAQNLDGEFLFFGSVVGKLVEESHEQCDGCVDEGVVGDN